MDTIKTRKWNGCMTYFDAFCEELRSARPDLERDGTYYYHDFALHGGNGKRYTAPVNVKVETDGGFRYSYVKRGGKWVSIYDDGFDLAVL